MMQEKLSLPDGH